MEKKLTARIATGVLAAQLLIVMPFGAGRAEAVQAANLSFSKAHTLIFEEKDNGIRAAIYGSNGALEYAADAPALITVAEGRIMKAVRYEKGYDEVTVTDGGVEAVARVISQNGSEFAVRDVYAARGNGITVSRSITVIKAGEDDFGFQSRVEYAVNPESAGTWEQLEYFIPALLYKDTDNVTPTAMFAAGAFSHEQLLARETRSGLPMVMLRNPQTGGTLSLSHIALGVSDNVTAKTGSVSTRVDEDCHLGAIGLTNLRGTSPAATFVYPYLETPVVYGASSYKEVCYHPVTPGYTQTYEFFLYAADTGDYNAAMIECYRANYDNQDIRIADIDIEKLYDISVKDLNDIVTPNGLGIGFPFAVYVDNGENFAVCFQMGFIGMQTTLANHLIRSGLEDGDEARYQNGVAIVDFWSKFAATDSGVVKIWFDDYSFRPYPPFLRIMTDGLEGMLDAYMTVTNAGRADAALDKWRSMIFGYADFLVRAQNGDGSFYRAYDYGGSAYQPGNADGLRGDKNTFGDSKLNSAIPIRFLVRMYEFSGEEKYLTAALRAGEFVLDNLYGTGKYVGGTPDNPNTVDKEAGIYAMYAYSALYSATGDQKYLDAMEQAAVYSMSWTYTYSFKVANLTNLKAGVPTAQGKTDGLSFIATGHSAVDNFIAFTYYEFFKLYVWTGDTVYRDMALFLQNNTKQTMNLDGQYGFDKESYMIEATNLAGMVFKTAETRGVWLPWIGCANIEPISQMARAFGVADVEKLKDVPVDELRAKLSVYGAGGKQ